MGTIKRKRWSLAERRILKSIEGSEYMEKKELNQNKASPTIARNSLLTNYYVVVSLAKNVCDIPRLARRILLYKRKGCGERALVETLFVERGLCDGEFEALL